MATITNEQLRLALIKAAKVLIDELEKCAPKKENPKDPIIYHWSRAVIRIDKNGNETIYPTVIDAARKNKLDRADISKCCNGVKKRNGGKNGKKKYTIPKTVGGYKWRFQNPEWKGINRPINMFTKDGVYIRSFNTQKDAAIFIGHRDWTSIGKVCNGIGKTAGGYVWKYANP